MKRLRKISRLLPFGIPYLALIIARPHVTDDVMNVLVVIVTLYAYGLVALVAGKQQV